MPKDLSKRKHGAFFTENWLSQTLVNKIERSNVNFFADFGSGQGSLVRALVERWNNLQGSTIELSLDNILHLRENFPSFTHLNLDITDVYFPDRFWKLCKPYKTDIVVSNPPYIPVPLTDDIKEIALESGLIGKFRAKTEIPAEILFMLQAIRTFPDAPEMAFIIPDFIITAEKNEYIRQFMIDNIGLYKIIEVGKKAFKSTDVKTHIAFFNDGLSQDKILVESLNNEKSTEITKEEFCLRGDYSFHVETSTPAAIAELGDIARITRGNLLMHVAKEKHIKPFHTTDFFRFSESYIDLNSFCLDRHYRSASVGDILLGRVGRNILEQVLIVGNGTANISDCIFTITLNENSGFSPEEIIRCIKSAAGRTWLESRTKGSGAKSISLKDLNMFPIWKENA